MALHDFTKLNLPFDVITTIEELEQRIDSGHPVSNTKFEKNKFVFCTYANGKRKISERQFINCSFKKTLISKIHFEKCIFRDCLFEFAIIEDCEFHRCTFNCINPHKIIFRNTYIDPKTLDNIFPAFDNVGHIKYFVKQFFHKSSSKPDNYENVKVHLYQNLLENADAQVQPDHVAYAKYKFRKSQRGVLVHQLLRGQIKFGQFLFKYIKNFLYWMVGYGIRLRNFLLTYSICIAITTVFNTFYWSSFGFHIYSNIFTKHNFYARLINSLFFTFYTTTTIGSDFFQPKTYFGLEVMMIEGYFGYLMLAIFSALLINKFIK